MVRIIAVLVVIALLYTGPAHADEALPRVRYSVAPEKVRVVLDLPAETVIAAKSGRDAVVISTLAPLTAPLPPITLDDPAVAGIAVTPDAQGQAVLTVSLRKPRKHSWFTLPAAGDKPFRVVVDVLNTFNAEEQRSVSPAITYTRLERQTEDRYLAAHLLTANLRDPNVRLGVVAAQGERETVASMVKRAGAAGGVNGGYFLQGTRPVGLLKVDGKVVTLPIWGRTAVALPADGLPLFGNPHGRWRVTPADGAARDLPDALDVSPQTPAPTALVFSGLSYTQAPAVPAGLNVLVCNGAVVSRGNAAVPLGRADCVIQLMGDDLAALDAALAVGAAVTVTPVLDAGWDAYPYAVGAGPRLLRDGAVALTGQQERFQPDILNGRAARTGLGVTADGRLILVAVEAPGPFGGGATLEELALLLKSRGAVDALNLDGGGSTNMVVGGATVNYAPGTWLRPVASGVLVYDSRVAAPAAVTAKQ